MSSLCRGRSCGCSFTSGSLHITGDGTPYNIETYEGVATESPDTLPALADRFDGMRVFATDTRRILMWDDVNGWWRVLHQDRTDVQSWTISNVTLGTGGLSTMSYWRSGPSVHVSYRLVLGTGGDLTGQPQLTLPVSVDDGTVADREGSMSVTFYDASSSAMYAGWFEILGGGSQLGAPFFAADGSSSFSINGTSPFDWTSGDEMWIYGEYPTKDEP